VLVWVLVLLPLLLLMAALLVEGGLMYRTYRLAQMAADAAAHAAAQELDVALYLRTGRVALTPNAATVARNIAATNTRGQVTCGVPQVWANRVELICQADLHPVILIGSHGSRQCTWPRPPRVGGNGGIRMKNQRMENQRVSESALVAIRPFSHSPIR